MSHPQPGGQSASASAGHYIPNLALEIVKYNDLVDESQRINLKGFLAGDATCWSMHTGQAEDRCCLIV